MTLEERKTQFKEVKEQNQQLVLDNRRKIKVTGVSEVENFSDTLIEIDTCLGKLTVKGCLLYTSKMCIRDRVEPVIAPSRGSANHQFTGGYDL